MAVCLGEALLIKGPFTWALRLELRAFYPEGRTFFAVWAPNLRNATLRSSFETAPSQDILSRH